MIVGIEGRCLVGQPTGVGRYLRSLLREMLSIDREIRFRVFLDRKADDGLGDHPRLERRVLNGSPGRNVLLWIHRSMPALLRKDPVDVAHFPFYTLPRRPPCPSVVTIHDITFTLHPEWYTWRSRIAFGFAPGSARRAAHVLTVSERSRSDLIERYGLDPSRVTAAPLAADPSFAPRAEEEVTAALGRHGLRRPYLIHVGSLHPRRNLERLLDAFAEAAGPETTLLLAGRVERPWRSVEPMIAKRGLTGRVRHLGYVPEADLPALIGGAVALLYPSLYEGFGLPVLEGMACGTPVVTSTVSALPETAGSAALLVNPHSTREIAGALRSVLGDAALRARLRAAGLARAAEFSWRRAALATLSVYAAARASR